MFVRSTKSRGHTYYTVVENRRVDGKHRQFLVERLGYCHTVAVAIKLIEKQIRRLKRRCPPGAEDTPKKAVRVGSPAWYVREIARLKERRARLKAIERGERVVPVVTTHRPPPLSPQKAADQARRMEEFRRGWIERFGGGDNRPSMGRCHHTGAPA